MPYITLIPVGELLNHDNVQTYYIYQYNSEKPDASTRYSGITDENDHDDELVSNDSILNLNCNLVLNINEELNKTARDEEKMKKIKEMCSEVDISEENKAKEHKKYRPPDMDLTENDEKEASICTGPDEHYLPGSEVYMSYGRYSNRQLLSTYGFALKENWYNYARIKILLKELANSDEQLEFFNKIEAFCIFKMKKKEICLELLRTLRGISWKTDYSTDSFLHPKLIELELSSISKAILILEKVISSFPTSLEEDLLLLTQELPLRKYFAVLYRSQVKDIMKTQIKYLQILKVILQRSQDGVPVEEIQKIVDTYETAEGNLYIEIEKNRKALGSYLGILLS